jgi:hypothetical protein
MKLQKVNTYKFKDTARVFLYAVLAPQILAASVLLAMGVFAALFGLDYSVVENSFVTKFISLFIVQIAFLLVFYLYNKANNIDWVKATKIKNKLNLKQIGIIILIAVSSLFFISPLISLVDYLISLTGYTSSSELPIDLSNLSGFIVGIFALAVFPAVAEELIFRGVVFSGLKRFGYKKAIIFSAIIFALMHMSIQQTVYQIIIGVILAYSFYVTGSLLGAILLHFVNNFLIVIMAFYTQVNEIPMTETASFKFLADYVQVFGYLFIGLLVIWFLFGLLKEASNNKPHENNIKLENSNQNLEQDFNTITNNEHTLVNEKTFNKNPAFNKNLFITLFAAGICIALWLVNFIGRI